MKTFEITVKTNAFGAELVADIMGEATFGGVKIIDPQDVKSLLATKEGYWDYVDESLLKNDVQDVFVSCFSSAPKKTVSVLVKRIEELKKHAQSPLGSLEIVVTEANGDWHKVWKSFFKPLKLGKIVVVPKWEKYECKEDEKVLLLDSGIAFGTGEHETTSMCVELLQEIDLSGKTVADIGCGSGILGISAVLLGAKTAALSDLDASAVAAAAANVKLNKLQSVCGVRHADLLAEASGVYDAVTANLTADILLLLSRGLAPFVARGGSLIISGIIDTKLDVVLSAFSHDFAVQKVLSKNDWRAVLLHKKEAQKNA